MFVSIALLALGTYVFRLIGPTFAHRFQMSEWFQQLLSDGSIVLLFSLALTGALLEGHTLAGWARPIGVGAGVLMVMMKMPFPAIVLGAAFTTALLRWLGVH